MQREKIGQNRSNDQKKSIQKIGDLELLDDIRSLIEKTRYETAGMVNANMTILYWEIGTRIRKEILQEKRSEYGKRIVQTLSKQLVQEFGRSFQEKNVRRMIQFSEVFNNEKIVVPLARQLSWSHFVVLIPLKDPPRRDFYAEMCRIERWSKRTLRNKIDSMLYERTALSRKPEDTIFQELNALREDDRMTADIVFQDPYILDFLGLKDTYSIRDLETTILRELESFILELGDGFAFIARQKRMRVDNRDYFLDLLFYHRNLKRLVAIELKLNEFRSEYKGQMELYLRWLEKYEVQKGEQSPIGLILCTGKSEEHIELLQLDKSGVRVSEYFTDLPPRDLLERKLKQAITTGRKMLEDTKNPIT